MNVRGSDPPNCLMCMLHFDLLTPCVSLRRWCERERVKKITQNGFFFPPFFFEVAKTLVSFVTAPVKVGLALCAGLDSSSSCLLMQPMGPKQAGACTLLLGAIHITHYMARGSSNTPTPTSAAIVFPISCFYWSDDQGLLDAAFLLERMD